jgi:hypothetical protein
MQEFLIKEDWVYNDSQPLTQPLTDEERVENYRYLSKLYPANRLRLMFGQPLLPEQPLRKKFEDMNDEDL